MFVYAGLFYLYALFSNSRQQINAPKFRIYRLYFFLAKEIKSHYISGAIFNMLTVISLIWLI